MSVPQWPSVAIVGQAPPARDAARAPRRFKHLRPMGSSVWALDNVLFDPDPVIELHQGYAEGPREFKVELIPHIAPQYTPAHASTSCVKAGDARLFTQSLLPDGTLQAETSYTMRGIDWQPTYSDADFALIEAMAQAGVNTVRFRYAPLIDPQSVRILDALQAKGIRAIVPIDDFQPSQPGLVDGMPRLTIRQFKNHPAILMWEAWGSQSLYFAKLEDPKRAAAVHILSGSITGDDVSLATRPVVYSDADVVCVAGDSSVMASISMWSKVTTLPFYIGGFGTPREWDQIYFDLSADRTNGRIIGGTLAASAFLSAPESQEYLAVKSRYDMSLYTPPVQEQAVISVDSGSVATFKVNGETAFSKSGMGNGGRGVTVAVLDQSVGTRMREIVHFDTWALNLGQQIIDFVEAQPHGSIIAFSVADEGGFLNWQRNYVRKSPHLDTFLESLGSTEVMNIAYRDSWAFITRKGFGALAEKHGSGINVNVEITVAITPEPNAGKRP